MARKIVCLMVATMLLLTVFAGCGASKPAASTEPAKAEASKEAAPAPKPDGKQIVLRLAEIHPKGYPTELGDEEFARLVGEKTKGRIKVEVYFGAQLGQEKAVIEQVQFGAIDFARISVSPVAEFAKELNVLQLPYIYRDREHMWKVLQGPIGDDLLKSVEKAKMVGLNWYDAGARSFYNSKKEIKSVEDLKGLKIRVQESKLMMGLVKALGASPTPMPMGDVYSALQTGVIDGAENNWPSYISASHFEVAKNYTVDRHTMVPEITVASKQTMDKLSKEDQEAIRAAAKEAIEFQKAKWIEQEKKDEEKAKAAGCKITYLDDKTVAEFQKAVAPLYDDAKDFADLIKKIQETK
ncbi:MAG: TRAP transporter substrate-binding protein [Clostridia bacterium]|nr:TRAP transporter substrate-binding protein [Clostridia bacterium]